ncbi:unnamed protein product, partial [marine sediment metagenome]
AAGTALLIKDTFLSRYPDKASVSFIYYVV